MSQISFSFPCTLQHMVFWIPEVSSPLWKMFCLHIFSRCLSRSRYYSTINIFWEPIKASSLICPQQFSSIRFGSGRASCSSRRISEHIFALVYCGCERTCCLAVMRRASCICGPLTEHSFERLAHITPFWTSLVHFLLRNSGNDFMHQNVV